MYNIIYLLFLWIHNFNLRNSLLNLIYWHKTNYIKKRPTPWRDSIQFNEITLVPMLAVGLSLWWYQHGIWHTVRVCHEKDIWLKGHRRFMPNWLYFWPHGGTFNGEYLCIATTVLSCFDCLCVLFSCIDGKINNNTNISDKNPSSFYLFCMT